MYYAYITPVGSRRGHQSVGMCFQVGYITTHGMQTITQHALIKNITTHALIKSNQNIRSKCVAQPHFILFRIPQE